MAYTTIDKPTDYFNTKLWSGTGASNSLTGIGFQPDWVWIKSRTLVDRHLLSDSVRGVTKGLSSDSTLEEQTNAQFLTSFDSDGFTVGTNSKVNQSGETYVGWSWLAGGSASSNSNGSITSSVSANTTAGFSIVSYTGTGANATVGHGLGVAPAFIIFKSRSKVDNWTVYHQSISPTKRIELNSTGASATSSVTFNNTATTSSVFSIGTNSALNGSGETNIAYCFAEKKGYSKFGSYTGNGNADGTFVYTGFKPAFLMFKVSSTTENWYIIDNKRAPNNDIRNYPDFMPVLYPNLTNAEGFLSDEIDMLSNGFKMRGTNSAHNTSGATYIYMAFAENPFVTSTGIPTTAR